MPIDKILEKLPKDSIAVQDDMLLISASIAAASSLSTLESIDIGDEIYCLGNDNYISLFKPNKGSYVISEAHMVNYPSGIESFITEKKGSFFVPLTVKAYITSEKLLDFKEIGEHDKHYNKIACLFK